MNWKKDLVKLASFLGVVIPTQIYAQTAFYDSLSTYQSSKWQKADWANGDPFNCGWSPDHAGNSNGELVITLDNVASHNKQYSSCEYRTSASFSYGRFEAKIKAAKCTGTVTAFFTYDNATKDEIDFEFLGKNTQQVQVNYYVGGNGGHEHMIDLGFDASADYHVYKVEWTNTYIKWFVDGVEKYSITNNSLPSHPMQIMLSLWNGIGVDDWLGAFNYTGPLYAHYDYVKYDPGSTGVRINRNEIKEEVSPAIYLTSNSLNISLMLAERGRVSVKLLTLSGKTIGRFNYSCQTGRNDLSIPVSKIPAKGFNDGSFICKISGKDLKVSREIFNMK